jgi:hypothetical protein
MNKKNPNKVAIYRCVFSDYDIILPELQVYENIDYYLFTDNANLDIFPYKTIFTDSKYRSPSLDNRFIKIILPDILKAYDTTIYVDANIAIVGDFNILINEFWSSNSDIGLFSHPCHNSLEEEVELCIAKNKSSEMKLKNELNFYSNLDFPGSGKFSENSVIFRRKHSSNMNNAMSHWFNLVKKFSGRDQMSLPTIRSQYNLQEYFFDFSPRTPHNNHFIALPHKQKWGWGLPSIIKYLKYFIKFNAKSLLRYFIFYRSKVKQ